jgi:hypothetical protein
VQEHGREETPVLAVGDEGAEENALREDLVAGAVDLAAQAQLEQVDGDIDRD